MREITLPCGISIDDTFTILKERSKEFDTVCYAEFNDKTLYSTDTLNEMYRKVIGCTKAEHEAIIRKEQERLKREEEEHQAKIPELTKKYRESARGVIIPEQYDYWDEIVPIRLNDLYKGMELQATLDICKVMKDEAISYDERLHKAYDLFRSQGHSGMSAHLVANMLRKFCVSGEDIADAVLNFRFDNTSVSN